MAKDIDEALEKMFLDDLEDAERLRPIDYAKFRGMYPQKVYKAIRDKRLETEWCACGHKVVNVAEADKLFKVGDWKDGGAARLQGTGEAQAEEEEVPGSDLDA
jgi:hypothetical protein